MIAAIICFFVVLCVGFWMIAKIIENAGALLVLLLVFAGIVVLTQVIPDHAPTTTHTPPAPVYADDYPEMKRAIATYGYEPVRVCFEATKARRGTEDELWGCVKALPPKSAEQIAEQSWRESVELTAHDWEVLLSVLGGTIAVLVVAIGACAWVPVIRRRLP